VVLYSLESECWLDILQTAFEQTQLHHLDNRYL